MSTASTKSRNRKKKGRTEAAASKGKPVPPFDPKESLPTDLSEKTWRLIGLVILAVAAFLRLYKLDLVPFHHDEGVNGNFLVRLVREGVYQYDPANYHGPPLYYFSAIAAWVLKFLFGGAAQDKYGLHTVTVRLVPAMFGLATVGLVLLLRRRLGSVGSLCAAALIAVSPGAVYLSRYFIHETLFVFFTLGIVVAALNYYEERHPIYLILASASAALLFATKETAVISAAVLVIALVTTQIYLRMRKSFGPVGRKSRKGAGSSSNNSISNLLDRFGGPQKVAIWLSCAVVVFIAINVLFYSSFFRNYPKGVYDAVKTFEFWTKTGKEAHVHSITTYIGWLRRQESPLLLLGSVGAAIVVLNPRNAFALFSALWAFGLLAAYSLISYKTPWLTLNFVIPLALIGGYALQAVYEHALGQLRAVIVIMSIAMGINGYQVIDLNFFNYDNDDQYYVYVYAHTRRDMLALVDEIDRIAARTNQGNQIGITIASPDYWPLPWDLRDYKHIGGYQGRVTPTTEPIIIASEGQGAEVESTFGDRYRQVNSGLNQMGSYRLRPGVNLLLYVRQDVFERTR